MRYSLVILFLLKIQLLVGQQFYSLPNLIDLAIEKSPASLQAKTMRENRFWQWKTYKSNYKPQLALDGKLPNFSRTNQAITQPDGSIVFQPIANSNTLLNLSLSQTVGLTGGQIFVSSQVQRFDDFDRNQVRYNSNPVIIGFNQPLFSYNALKWDNKIEPLRYREAQRKYIQEKELISVSVTAYFFDLLLAQINLEIAQKNLSNNDTLLKIAQIRFDKGRLSKNDLLQLKLNLVKSQKDVSQATFNLETASLSLKSYIGIKNTNNMLLELPAQIPVLAVQEEQALIQANKNREETIAFQRRILEAERDVAKAKGDNGFNANLYATFGLTQRAETIQEVYNGSDDQQTLELGFRIPIMDWGRQKARIKTALANQELVKYSIEQEKVNFEQQIISQVKQIRVLREQLRNTEEADEIAQERFEIAKNRYFIGDIGITDYNIAQQEKDQAKRDYIKALQSFWQAYYGLRLLTLYDFENNMSITYE